MRATMVVGRRAAKATAVVKVAGPVVVMAEEIRTEARPDTRGESGSGKGGKGGCGKAAAAPVARRSAENL